LKVKDIKRFLLEELVEFLMVPYNLKEGGKAAYLDTGTLSSNKRS
jgi:hypothetical protein